MNPACVSQIADKNEAKAKIKKTEIKNGKGKGTYLSSQTAIACVEY